MADVVHDETDTAVAETAEHPGGLARNEVELTHRRQHPVPGRFENDLRAVEYVADGSTGDTCPAGDVLDGDSHANSHLLVVG
jgi:hypothetical protein